MNKTLEDKMSDILEKCKSKRVNLRPFLRLGDLDGSQYLKILDVEELSPEEQEKKKGRGSKIRLIISMHGDGSENEYVWECAYGTARQVLTFVATCKTEYFRCRKTKNKEIESTGKKGCWILAFSEGI